jgi:enterochelin esterase-like enzyme
MSTRRQILFGGAAVLVVGVGVAAEEAGDPRVRRFLHRLGLAHSPDHTVADSHAHELSGTLTSAHMPKPVGWTIAVPAIPMQGVIYCMHGHGSDHRMAFDEVRLPDVVAAAAAPLAVAAVDGGSDSYWHSRTDGADPLTMFLDEFIPMVEQHIGPTVNRAVLGWSMGGYGALLAGERAANRLKVVAAASPALWTSPGATPAIAFDGATDYHRNDVFAGIDQLAALTVRIDCGTDDPFYEADRQFADRLPTSHPGSFGPGFHDAAYWRSVAPAQVATINSAFGIRA